MQSGELECRSGQVDHIYVVAVSIFETIKRFTLFRRGLASSIASE